MVLYMPLDESFKSLSPLQEATATRILSTELISILLLKLYSHTKFQDFTVCVHIISRGTKFRAFLALQVQLLLHFPNKTIIANFRFSAYFSSISFSNTHVYYHLLIFLDFNIFISTIILITECQDLSDSTKSYQICCFIGPLEHLQFELLPHLLQYSYYSSNFQKKRLCYIYPTPHSCSTRLYNIMDSLLVPLGILVYSQFELPNTKPYLTPTYKH